MKISTASKKVLASALSAAMVVAFAPTVAFATIADGTNNVTVKFDVNGGVVKDVEGISDSHTGVVESVKGSVNSGKLTVSDITKYTGVAEKNGAAIDYWFYDANGDGQDTSAKPGDTSGDLKYDAANGLNTATLAKDTTEITLKAHYAEPAAKATFEVKADETIETAKVAASNLNKDYQYYATLTLADGTVLTSEIAAKDTGAEFDFGAAIATAKKTQLAKGAYKFAIYKNGSADAVATDTVDIYAVTLSAGAGYGTYTAGAKTTYLVKKDTTYGDLFSKGLTRPTSEAGSYDFVQYVDANGTAVVDGAKAKVTSDITLTAVYNNLQVSEVKVDTAAKTLSFKALGKFADLGADGQYDATVTGPNGFSKVIKGVDVNTTSANATLSATLTFGADWEADKAVTSKLEAGEYTVSIAPVAKEGKTLTAEQAGQVIAPASATLATVTYDLDGGSWIPGTDGKDQDTVKELVTLAQVGDAISGTIATKAGNAANETILKAPELKSFKEWSYNGKSADNAGAVTASGVTVKAVWQDANIAAPEVSITASDAKYVFTVTAAADTTVKYGIGNAKNVTANKTLTAGATITVDPTVDKYVAIKAESTKNNLESETVVYASYANYTTEVGNAMTAIMNTSTSASAANKPVRYGDTLTTLKTDAEAAVKAAGYQSTKDWDKTVAGINSDALDKVAAIEKANVEALKTVTKGTDGKYSYINAATADAAVAQINAVVADYAGFTGKDKATYKQSNTISGVKLDTNSNMAAYIAAAKKAVEAAKAAKVVVPAADVEAAAAVDAQIAKLAADYAEVTKDNYQAAADAAVEAQTAYASLSATAKALVKSDSTQVIAKVLADAAVVADQVKDEEAKKAAEEAQAKLVAAQDKAAAAGVSGKTKTVKASKKSKKTTKAYSYTVKTPASDSGAKASSKKVSATKGMTVKGSKVTLKKGAKKGKTYTAKVKVTYGQSSKTVKVVFKVK